jgi:multidrug efflux pump subunit AcrA (membrane-fusion protein)
MSVKKVCTKTPAIRFGSTAVALSLLGTGLFFGGCAKEEEEPLITVEAGDEELDYGFVTCIRDNIEDVVKIRCDFRKNSEQEVYFPVSGKKIEKVYVNVGDTVKKGDVLAAINVGSLETDIEDLQYSISRNELLEGYLSDQYDLDTQSVYLDYYYGYLNGNDDSRDKRLDSLKKQLNNNKQGYDDSLEFDRKKLAKLKRDLSESRVYAAFDGTISYVADNLEGSTTNVETCIMRVLDNEDGYFEASAGDYLSYFEEGEPIKMTVQFGDGKGDYELVPLEMDQWGDTQKFSILSGENAADLGSDSRGEMYIVIDSKENVLIIPKNAVRYAGEDAYVYVLNDNGLRDVCWIETGIEYDGKVEIVSGLEEGDKVITH